MIDALSVIYSAPFAIGAMTGAAAMKFYQWMRCRHLDKVSPLPSGDHRHVPGVNFQLVGALMAVLALGYVLFQTNGIEQRYKGLAERVETCQLRYQAAMNRRTDITTANDELSILQRDKLTELDALTGLWVDRLINPPPHLAGTGLNDPRRQGYSLTVTRFYQERATALRAEIAGIRVKQSELAADRAAHPLPDARC